MRRLVRLFAGSLVAAAALGVAVAQEAPPVGAAVKDVKGQAVGVIEKVVVVAGRPRQVQVRQGPVLRTLPIDGLYREGAAYVTVLSKAEFDALPASN